MKELPFDREAAIAYLQAHVSPEMCAVLGYTAETLTGALARADDSWLKVLLMSCNRFHARKGVA